MEKGHVSGEEKKTKQRKARLKPPTADRSGARSADKAPLGDLQHRVGNRAVQRLLAQRSGGEGAFELEEDTEARINRERGGGQALDPGVQEQMQAATGADLGEVRVHTSPEADELNQELGAKAFTSGKDVYFRDGMYAPHSSEGQELLAHELTHVAQQGGGAAGSAGGRMRVNAPDDTYEKEADAVAKSVTAPGAAAGVQLQEEETVQMQEEEEELVQAQEMEEEEETIQMQAEEEEETVQMQEEEEELVQAQEMEEEEELAS